MCTCYIWLIRKIAYRDNRLDNFVTIKNGFSWKYCCLKGVKISIDVISACHVHITKGINQHLR